MTGRRSHGRLSALNGVVHQGSYGSGSYRTRGYDGADGRETRATILEALASRVQIAVSLQTLCRDNTDALDAVICLFAAKAVADGLASVDDPAAAKREGWIAVHPGDDE